MPVLPTDSEKHESKSTHVASRSQCKTEDSRKHLEIKWSMDRGFLARSTNANLVTITMLIQKPHNAAEAHQVSHEAPEPHAVKCALEDLDANGLGRVLPKGSVESVAQTFVVRKIESSAKTNDPELPEESGCRANCKGIVPPWVAGCATRVLRRSEKHQNVRTRLKLRKFRVVSTQDGETMDPGTERSEMATVNPVRVTGTSLSRTGASDECPTQRCTASEHWQPGVISSPPSVLRNGRKLALKPVMGHRRKSVSRPFIRRKSATFGCPQHKGVSSRHVSERRKKLGRVLQTETEECTDQTAGTRSTDYLRLLAEAEMRAVPDKNAVLTCAGGASGGQSGVAVSKESLQNPSSGIPDPDTARH